MFAVLAHGLVSALGASHAATHAALAEGQSALRRQRRFIGSDFAPQLTAFEALHDGQPLAARLESLAGAALDDLFAQAAALDLGPERRGLRLVLCGPTPGPLLASGQMQRLGSLLAERVGERLGLPVAWLRLLDRGGSGFVESLTDDAPDQTSLLVISVDSFATRDRLRALVDAGQLFSNARPYGFVPGEAASAVLLRPVAPGSHPELRKIAGFGVQHEPVREIDQGDSDYRAMTAACQAALSNDLQVGHLLSDWNNSRYRAAELSYAQLRTQSRHAPDLSVVHPALTFGETGAAFGGLALGLACGFDAASLVVVSGASDAHARSAFTVLPRGH